MTSRLADRHGDPVFNSQPAPMILLDADLVIRAANTAYLAVTDRDEEELLGVPLFDAFPENPAVPEVRAAANLAASLETVLTTGRPHHMIIQRYDIPDRNDPTTYVRKHWVPVNSPIQHGDRVVGVAHRVEDVSLLNEDVISALQLYRDVLASGDLRAAAARDRIAIADSFLSVVESYTKLAEEVTGLREAMSSRATIEQAKGIIMHDRRCSADEAFQVLKELSMNSNVRLVDVAAAIVYQVQGP